MKAYDRTENETTTRIPLAEGLEEINYAQMDGKRFVRTMSASSRGDADIEYNNGRKVVLRQVEVEAPKEPEEWSGTRTNGSYQHRFDPETLRGRCNPRFRPVRHADGYALKSRSQIAGGAYAHLYTFCPRCEQHP
ncbi:hypothetical protein ACH4VR_29600 [Streptomyces sp. NPDC020883]|uniref:hypothetical protein n=1 Tax=Streptomyces sp. NPDC020883 TaxID=3365099 RepID=UPI0037AA83AB